MGVRRPNAPWITVRGVYISGPFTSDIKCGTVTAPSVTGYDFVMWVCSASVMYVGAPYCANPTEKTSDVYDIHHDLASQSNTGISCYALYQRTSD